MSHAGASHTAGIGRRSEICAHTGERFEPGEPIVVCLVEPAIDASKRDDGAVRLDFKAPAWDAGARPAGDILAWWRTEARVAAKGSEPALSREDMLDLVLGAGGDAEPHDAEPDDSDSTPSRTDALRYVLALELVRKRALSLVETDRDHVKVREVITAKQRDEGVVAREVTIASPPIDRDELARLAERLGPLVGIDDAP